MSVSAHIAVDLGASGGRVALGFLDREKEHLEIEIVHRFLNGGTHIHSGGKSELIWDVELIWREVLDGLTLACQRAKQLNINVESVGVDSWAVDYTLVSEGGGKIGLVNHYRDPRTAGIMDAFLRAIPRLEVYQETGVQFLPFNTLFQFIAHRREKPAEISMAASFLLVPDYFHWLLSGVRVCERTNASTTQFYNPSTQTWSREFSKWSGCPSTLLPLIVEPGTPLGLVQPEIARIIGIGQALVVATATHDTAAAVAAVPALGADWAYISSGTWSLVGIELPEPILSESACISNFTNESGVNGTQRFLKNVMGLWILQECRRSWEDISYSKLYEQAELSEPFKCWIDPDDARFLSPGIDMVERVKGFCAETEQHVPSTVGEIARCILESLAFRYRQVLEEIVFETGTPITTLHIVGGGSQIDLLNRMTAGATGIRVITGPTDASLIGNILVQAEGLKLIPPETRRKIVRNSFGLGEVPPENTEDWNQAFTRFQSLVRRSIQD